MKICRKFIPLFIAGTILSYSNQNVTHDIYIYIHTYPRNLFIAVTYTACAIDTIVVQAAVRWRFLIQKIVSKTKVSHVLVPGYSWG